MGILQAPSVVRLCGTSPDDPEATFEVVIGRRRVLAAYGGVFVAGSLLWGVVMDGFRPGRWDITGALICLLGVAVIMYAPRG